MTGSVYFIAISDGPIKIGWTTKSVEERVAELQTGCPWPIIVIGTVVGSIEHERMLHEEFALLRMNGEWFQRTTSLISRIAEIIRSGLPDISAQNDGTFRALIRLFGGVTGFRDAMNLPDFHARTMYGRNSIPPAYWQQTVAAAKASGVDGVTLDALATAAAIKGRAAIEVAA